MTTYNWTELNHGDVIPFDPTATGDGFVFNDASITAGLGPDADHQLDFFVDPDPENEGGTICFFAFGDKEIGLQVDPRQLSSSNVTFASGSVFDFGGNSADVINGGTEGDWLIGSAGNDVVNGGDGNDMLVVIGSGQLGTGAYGNDTLNGGRGRDQLFYDGAEEDINVNLATGVATGGRAGPSTLSLTSIENAVTGSGDDTLTGSQYANLLFSQEGADRLIGNGGNDTLDGGTGIDVMSGGVGNDKYFANSKDDLAVEKANQGIDTVFSKADYSLGNHVENLTLTGSANREGSGNDLDNIINGNSGDNLLKGKSGDDTLNGHEGSDTLDGGSGNDSIDGGEGVDTMIGGNGDDRYSVIEAGDTVIEEEDDGFDTIVTNRTITMASHVENLVWLSSGEIGAGECIGNDLDNVMSAAGGPGELTMDGAGGSDTISFSGVNQGVTVDLDLDEGSSNIVEHLFNMENAIGGNLGDSLTGNEVNNRLDGSAGVDTMTGGYGNDTYVVDDPDDVVIEDDNIVEGGLVLPGAGSGQAGIAGITDTVIAAINYALGDFVENLTLSGTAKVANGNDLENVLTGNAKNNILNGAGGADTLNGAGGNDVLNGEGGNDTLVWGSGDTYNGSTGTDTLRLGTGNINMKNVEQDVVLNVERVDLRGDGVNVLTVVKADVLDMSSTDRLTVLGDAGDKVNAEGFTQIADFGTLQQFQRGTAFLLAEQDVTVVT